MRGILVFALAGSVLAFVVFATRRGGDQTNPPVSGDRNEALRRAQVLRAARDPKQVTFTNPPDVSSFGSDEQVSCRYFPAEASGTTPKFDCALATGEIV